MVNQQDAANSRQSHEIPEDLLLDVLFRDAPFFRFLPRTKLEFKVVDDEDTESVASSVPEEPKEPSRPPDWRLNYDFLISEVRKMNASQSAREASVVQKEEAQKIKTHQHKFYEAEARERPPRTAWAPKRPPENLSRKSPAQIRLRQQVACNRLALPPQHAHRSCHPDLHSKLELLKYPPMITAIHRLGHVAATFKNGGANTLMMNSCFKRGDLLPTDLHRAVCHCFCVNLSKEELGAIVRYCNQGSVGKGGDSHKIHIDPLEFLREFFKFGRVITSAETAKKRLGAALRKSRARAEEKKLPGRNKPKKKFSYAGFTTSIDNLEMKNKLAVVAAHYVKDQTVSRAFAPLLDANALQDTIRRCFAIDLSPAHLQALMNRVDKEGEGKVDGAKFMKFFMQLGQKEREKLRREKRILDEEHAQEQEQKLMEIEAKYGKRVEAPLTMPEQILPHPDLQSS